MGQNDVSVSQLNTKLSIGKRLDDAALELNNAFFLLLRTILLGHSLTITW